MGDYLSLTRRPESVSGSTSVDAILAQLFRIILFDLRVNSERFNYYMLRYLSDSQNGIPQNIKERAWVRGNIRMELLKEKMSWKVFYKGLRFLGIKQFTLELLLEHPGHRITHHSLKDIDLSVERDPGTLLAQLYRVILDELGINSAAFTVLMTRYVANLPRLKTAAIVSKPTVRNNLRKEVLQSSITWKVFCKGLWFLNVSKVTLKVNLETENLEQTSHQMTLIMQRSKDPGPSIFNRLSAEIEADE